MLQNLEAECTLGFFIFLGFSFEVLSIVFLSYSCFRKRMQALSKYVFVFIIFLRLQKHQGLVFWLLA